MSTEAEKEQKAAKLQQQYNKYQEIVSELESQVFALRSKLEEHLIVEKTLNEIPEAQRQERKCFKMIGGVLVNKSVDKVIEILKEEIEALKKEMVSVEAGLVKTTKEREDWMKGNNIKIVRQ
jgi:Prefoldin subunit.